MNRFVLSGPGQPHRIYLIGDQVLVKRRDNCTFAHACVNGYKHTWWKVRTKTWWHRVDLNHRHSGYEPLALPLSYGARPI